MLVNIVVCLCQLLFSPTLALVIGTVSLWTCTLNHPRRSIPCSPKKQAEKSHPPPRLPTLLAAFIFPLNRACSEYDSFCNRGRVPLIIIFSAVKYPQQEKGRYAYTYIPEPFTVLNPSTGTYFSSFRSWFRLFKVTLLTKDKAGIGQESPG